MRYREDFRSGQDCFGHFTERYKLRIKDSVANGDACRFYETGAQAHCYYKNGRLEGIFTYAFPEDRYYLGPLKKDYLTALLSNL